MKFNESAIPGVFLIEAEPRSDERGFFARLYSSDEFFQAGIEFTPMQINLSHNISCHTLRGLHYQAPPYAESKIVHVTQGAIYDVVLDIRQDSLAYGRWVAFNLDAQSTRALFIPEGCAHGFLTLKPETTLLYHMGRIHTFGHSKGYRWNDTALDIDWPATPRSISAADQAWPDFVRSKPG